MALQEEVSIVPRFSSDKAVECIRGSFGPFRQHTPVKVPLWAALEMDKLQQCTIDLPAWLHEEELKRMRDEERTKFPQCCQVPEHYIETAFAFLTQSRTLSGDPKERARTVLLLRELVELRRVKIIEGMKMFEMKEDTELDVTGMSAAELTCFRTRTTHALDTFLDLLQSRRVAEKDSSYSQSAATPAEDSSSRPL